MKKHLIAVCLLLCLLLSACNLQEKAPLATAAPTQIPAEEATEQPANTSSAPAQAYLVVTVRDAVYEPIPLVTEGRYTIKRGDHINIVEVTPNSICMAESSCDNQDCVLQGVVDLENRSGRVLQNMILCLPNEVMLELYTYEELKTALPGWEAQP